MGLTLCIQILLAGLVLAATVPKPAGDSLPSLDIDNDVVDMLIDAVREEMVRDNVEPIPLRDRETTADIGPVHFAIVATSGKLTGLTTLKRTEDSTVHYNHTEGHTAKIQATLGLDDTHITYHMDFD